MRTAADQGTGDGGGGYHGALHAGILRQGHGPGANLRAIGQADGFGADLRAAGQQHGAVNGVFQFADIARPDDDDSSSLSVDAGDGAIRHAIGLGIFAGEMMRQSANILGAFTQSGNAQIDDIQAIKKVFAEGAMLDRFGQIAVGGGDDADIHLDRLGAADPVNLALLNCTQQLGLQAGIHLADFVQQQRTAIGFFKFADAPGDGAGEGAFLMAEQVRIPAGFPELRRN